RKAVAMHFEAAFGRKWFPIDPIPGEASALRCGMLSRGWTITTRFEFGRWDPEMTCVDDIGTRNVMTKDAPQVLFANCFGPTLNYGNEIGSGSGWENIATEHIEPTCLSVMEHCRRMFDVFPLLLEDLDLSLLTTC